MTRHICLFLSLTLLLLFNFQAVHAQELITSTPVRINIPTDAAPDIEIIATATVTRTPTQAVVMIEAKADAGAANVRAEADIESERLGSIQAGEFYPVLGRYFRWIQFQFDTAPSGRGWVFDELVNIIGDESTIPDLSLADLPTVDPFIEASTETQIAITQTPGGLLTATAQSRFLSLPDEGATTGQVVGSQLDEGVLPTFTYPPDIVAAAPTGTTLAPVETPMPDLRSLTVDSNVPPIFPIILLGFGGLLGLVVSSLRR